MAEPLSFPKPFAKRFSVQARLILILLCGLCAYVSCQTRHPPERVLGTDAFGKNFAVGWRRGYYVEAYLGPDKPGDELPIVFLQFRDGKIFEFKEITPAYIESIPFEDRKRFEHYI